MVVADKKPFKVEIDGDVVDAIRAAFDRKKIGYWDGAEALFRWFAGQDGMLQSLILGQVDEKYRGEVAKMVLVAVADEERKHGGSNAPHGQRVAAKPRRPQPPQE